jgi:sulfate transport system substrate-binding protein
MNKIKSIAAVTLLAVSGLNVSAQTLLNASYDVAREFYKDYNAAFVANYKKTTGKDVKIDQAHGGSSAQARAVNDGLDADVVTMNTTTDIDFLASKGIVAADWTKLFPHSASPTSSTMLFLTRNGNPKNIKDWDDLIKPGIQVIVVNPKTGGNGRMAYMAAWGYVRKKGGSEADAAAFVANYKKTTGKDVKIDQAHGGSSAQARAVNDGLDADVVTMNTTTDIDFLASKGIVAADWTKRFPQSASPTSSTMLFLTRNGNPKNIKDWDDLIKPGIQVIVVNPKTGGNGRMAYMAAWGYVRKKGGSDADAAAFVAKLYKNVPVLAKGGRDATTIFLQRNIGDVLVTFESEVISVDNEFGAGKVDAIHPSISIVAENPVAVVERTVAKKGTGDLAKAYLNYLYSDEAQEIAAKHALRPTNPAILKKYSKTFKPLQLFTVNEVFGSFAEAQKVHFNDGGQFDKLYTVK